jgi:hypothetical protein
VDRFIKTLGLLIIMLFLLATGIDATLDRLASSSRHNTLTVYGQTNDELLVYDGDLARLGEIGQVDPGQMPRFLRRTHNSTRVPVSLDHGYTWL